MNVLILTKAFPDRIDDWAGIFVKEQADAIAKGHSVTVVKCKIDYDKFKPFSKAAVITSPDYPYPCKTIVASRSFPVYNQLNFIISAYYALSKIVEQNKPDIIHCHYAYPSGIIAWLIKRKTGIPFIITEHTKIKTTFRSIFHRMLSKIALRKSCKVIAVSTALEKELIHEKIVNTVVIPNLIDTDKISLRKKQNNCFVIGFLGSMSTNNKGLDLLLSACTCLPFEFRLKIGGTGILEEYYKTLCGQMKLTEKTIFVGGVNPKDRNKFFSDIDLFVLPSRYETFGLVLIEALSAGIPVVSTRCGGPEDIINEEAGLLTDINNSGQIAEAIQKIYSNFRLYDAVRLRNYCIEKFGQESFLKHIINLYQSCL
jgi:glycosyltransferase involved in cell wall biosynthesis